MAGEVIPKQSDPQDQTDWFTDDLLQIATALGTVMIKIRPPASRLFPFSEINQPFCLNWFQILDFQ